MENDTICYLFKENGSDILQVKFLMTLPLSLASKIIKYFELESDKQCQK